MQKIPVHHKINEPNLNRLYYLAITTLHITVMNIEQYVILLRVYNYYILHFTINQITTFEVIEMHH